MNPFEGPLGLAEYWAMLMRRRLHFLIPFVVVLAIVVAIAFLLPPTYRSEATFLVERQSVPHDMVASTVTSYVEEQIEQIRQRMVTRSNLLEIAEQFGLYAEQIRKDPAEAVRSLQDDVEVEMVDIQASDPNRSGQRTTTIAFTVAFHADTPETARAATAELAQRFLAEHQSRRYAQAEEVSVFLDLQAQELAGEIAELEGSLADFKQDELRQLPELMSTNLRLFEKTEQEIDGTEERIRGLREKIEVTRAELSLTPAYEGVMGEDGDRLLTSTERLSALTAEYLRASARYSPRHPDIIRLSREIRILAEQLGTEGRADELMNQLVGLQEQLRTARQQYSPSHPEVQRLERAVAAVQRGFQSELISGSGVDAGPKTPPDNPRYVALKTQLQSSEANLAAEQQKLRDLQSKLEEYEGRLYQTPVVERDFKSLSRNYETALSQYNELRNKQREAELARSLESGQSGERFTLTSEAYLPRMPDSPNRIAIILLGGFFALASAVGGVGIAEYMDRTIRGARSIALTLGAPPLAVVPRLRRRRFGSARAGGVSR